MTLALTFLGLLIAVIVAFAIGVLAAVYRDRWPDQVIRVFGVAALSTPSFWLAILLIQLFTLGLGLLPASGPARLLDRSVGLARPHDAPRRRPRRPRDRPALARRTSMVEELDRDYVRTALGAGIPA